MTSGRELAESVADRDEALLPRSEAAPDVERGGAERTHDAYSTSGEGHSTTTVPPFAQPETV